MGSKGLGFRVGFKGSGSSGSGFRGLGDWGLGFKGLHSEVMRLRGFGLKTVCGSLTIRKWLGMGQPKRGSGV